MPIVNLENDWGQVLLSHRPEIAANVWRTIIPDYSRQRKTETSIRKKSREKTERLLQHQLRGV